MSQFPSPRAAWRLAWVLCLALAGCATTPPAPLQPLSAEQQRSLLQGLAVFSFSGRVRVTTADHQGSTPAVEWQQRDDKSKVKLSGPLGVGGLQIDYSPEKLRLVTGRGDKLIDGHAENELLGALGFVPPFDALRYWVLGLPAPAAVAATASYDDAGLLQSLAQAGWLILYQRHVSVKTAAGSVQMPALLTATRDGLQLRLVVDRWHIN